MVETGVHSFCVVSSRPLGWRGSGGIGSPKTRERPRIPRPHAVPDGREDLTQRFQPCGQGLIAVAPWRASAEHIPPKCENSPRLCKSSLGRFRSGLPSRQLSAAPHAPSLSRLAIRPSFQRKSCRIDSDMIGGFSVANAINKRFYQKFTSCRPWSVRWWAQLWPPRCTQACPQAMQTLSGLLSTRKDGGAPAVPGFAAAPLRPQRSSHRSRLQLPLHSFSVSLLSPSRPPYHHPQTQTRRLLLFDCRVHQASTWQPCAGLKSTFARVIAPAHDPVIVREVPLQQHELLL